MGLGLVVGHLADVKYADDEGYAFVSDAFAEVNEVLRASGLEGHVEPDELDDQFSCHMLGYSSLHYLRRIAAHRALGRPAPTPGSPEMFRGTTVPELDAYVSRFNAGENVPYQHLIMHSDAEGFYVPIDFERVIVTPVPSLAAGWIGSTQRLQAECLELAGLFEMPLTMDYEARELSQAVNAQFHSGMTWPGRLWPRLSRLWSQKPVPTWKKYAIETSICLRLLAACEASLRTGAAIAFC